MKRIHLITFTIMTVCAVLSGCAPATPFPPKVLEKVSPDFDFEAWRDAPPMNLLGSSDSDIKIQLGGRIVQVTRNDKGIMVVAEQLPIVNHPVYGPTEDVNRTGDHEFAFLYPGALEFQDLQNGNRFIVVGTTTSRRPVVVNGLPKTELFLIADCLHVWQTGRTEIAEFKENVGAGYSPLPEHTSCVPQQ
jgi:starvation-inducible outer membrane lipoprotein